MQLSEVETAADTLRMAMADGDLDDVAAAERRFRTPLAWENYIRCLFLVAVVFMIGFLSWQPGMLRLSMFMSFANPSRGESLAWHPEEEHLPPAPEIKRQRAPAEWRLGPSYSASWSTSRSVSKEVKTAGGKLLAERWPRYSMNPWSWQNDAPRGHEHSKPDSSVQPPQKSASAYRVGDIAAWTDTQMQRVAAVETPDAVSAPIGAGLPPMSLANGLENSANPVFPSLPAMPPALSATPGPAGAPLSMLPPLGALDSDAPALSLPPDAASVAAAQTPPPSRQPEPGAVKAVAPAPAKSDPIDWKNQEITGPIPDAYLTIYPKLKFVGLCVPGQGYIRKYNQIAVPRDLTGAKATAQDGKTPYGKYYIADRRRDGDGPRLYLSWPSLEDAQRIGLDPGRVAEVANAWRRQELPPQNTAAGGGLGLNGLRNWVEATEGGFSLELPDMEEIYTALPDKAWVFVQP